MLLIIFKMKHLHLKTSFSNLKIKKLTEFYNVSRDLWNAHWVKETD